MMDVVFYSGGPSTALDDGVEGRKEERKNVAGGI